MVGEVEDCLGEVVLPEAGDRDRTGSAVWVRAASAVMKASGPGVGASDFAFVVGAVICDDTEEEATVTGSGDEDRVGYGEDIEVVDADVMDVLALAPFGLSDFPASSCGLLSVVNTSSRSCNKDFVCSSKVNGMRA